MLKYKLNIMYLNLAQLNFKTKLDQIKIFNIIKC